MSILGAVRLQVSYRRKTVRQRRLLEPAQIILVVGWPIMPDFAQCGRRKVMRIRCRLVVLKWIVVRAIRRLGCSIDTVRLCGARRRNCWGVSIGRDELCCWCKSPLEPGP